MDKKYKLIILAVLLVGLLTGAYFAYNKLSAKSMEETTAETTVSEKTTKQKEKETTEPKAEETTVPVTEKGTTAKKTVKEVPEEDIEVKPGSKALNFTVYDLNYNSVKLSDFAGKPIVINFFTTWCGPCCAELPHFEELYNEYGKDVNFLFVDLTDDFEEDVDNLESFVEEFGYTFPVYADINEEASLKYGITAFPHTFFINKDFYVVDSHLGMMEKQQIKNYIEKIL